MKHMSEKEIGAIALVFVLFVILGIKGAWEFMRGLEIVGVNLMEIIFSKHIAFIVVKGILMLFTSMGMFLGRGVSKLIFAVVTVLLGILIF